MRNILTQTLTVCATACVLTFVTGCKTNDHDSTQASAQPAPAMATPPAPTAPAAMAPATTSAAPALKAGPDGIYRVKAGSTDPFTDSAGHVWQGEVGFDGGDVIERDASTTIANTKDAGLFRSEHYSMNSFSCSVPNGKYIAKLYFAETYDGITDAGQRVFSYNVEGQHNVKDLDLWVKTGGADRAYVDTFPVDVTNGKFTITFTPNVENPEINAIELDPQH
ncbi:MAG TPA: malectin domain-containing carbohydrate-binding protein [Verrucomicrobiae bacterium]